MIQQAAAPPTAWPGALPEGLRRAIGPLAAFFVDTYQRHGPVVRMQLGPGKDMLVLAGIEANLFVSRFAQTHLRVRDFRSAQNAAYGARTTLVSSDGAEHRRLRRLQKRGYSRAALAPHGPAIAALVAEALDVWRADSGVAAVASSTDLVARLIGRCVLNHDPQGDVPALVDFLQTVVRVTLSEQLPASVFEQPDFREARRRSYALADATIAGHGCPVSGLGRPDLVDDLLRAAGEDPALLGPAELRVAVLGPYIGGLETVAHTLAFALYELARDPALAARIRTEVRATLTEPAACVEQTAQMPLLRCLVQETLRRYPVIPALRGTATQRFAFAGYQIEAGQTIAVGISVPHFLDEFFPDPLRFCIDRFGSEQSAQRRAGTYAPFGLGPHSCLGAGIAEGLLLAVIALIVGRYELALDPPEGGLTIANTPIPAPDQRLRIRLAEISG